MRGAHGAYTPNDITFSVRSMLDQHAHSLPGAMGSLKPIDAQVATVRHDLHQNLGFADGCGELWRRRSRQLFAHPLLRSMCFPRHKLDGECACDARMSVALTSVVSW
jgi:hypothetical protein